MFSSLFLNAKGTGQYLNPAQRVLQGNRRSYSAVDLLVFYSKAATKNALQNIQRANHNAAIFTRQSFLVRRSSTTMNYGWLNCVGMK